MADQAQVEVFPGRQWECRTPAQAGMDEGKLRQIEALLSQQVSGKAYSRDEDLSRRIGCVIRDGYMVYVWGDQTAKFNWYSSFKPVIATLVFFGIQDGKIASVDQPVADFIPGLQGKDRGITFRHLADMTSGYALQEGPGQAWGYNDTAIMLYCLSVQKALGMGTRDAVNHYLGFLGFEDGDAVGERHKGNAIVTTARDFARIGWLWLNKGRWDGRQVLNQAYFDAYCRPDVPADLPRSVTKEPADYLGIGSVGGGCNQGTKGPGMYGFNWWYNTEMGTSGKLALPDAPRDAFMAMGFACNYMVMLPTQRIVIAARGSWNDFEPDNRDGNYNTVVRLLVEAMQ